jgi:hypothetical protein
MGEHIECEDAVLITNCKKSMLEQVPLVICLTPGAPVTTEGQFPNGQLEGCVVEDQGPTVGQLDDFGRRNELKIPQA